jgi:hypothetical protein
MRVVEGRRVISIRVHCSSNAADVREVSGIRERTSELSKNHYQGD